MALTWMIIFCGGLIVLGCAAIVFSDLLGIDKWPGEVKVVTTTPLFSSFTFLLFTGLGFMNEDLLPDTIQQKMWPELMFYGKIWIGYTIVAIICAPMIQWAIRGEETSKGNKE